MYIWFIWNSQNDIESQNNSLMDPFILQKNALRYDEFVSENVFLAAYPSNINKIRK